MSATAHHQHDAPPAPTTGGPTIDSGPLRECAVARTDLARAQLLIGAIGVWLGSGRQPLGRGAITPLRQALDEAVLDDLDPEQLDRLIDRFDAAYHDVTEAVVTLPDALARAVLDAYDDAYESVTRAHARAADKSGPTR